MPPDDITPDWLSEVLGAPVAAAHPERVGTGQVGMNVRYRLAYVGEPPPGSPATVVAKLPSSDATSRATGVQLRNYEREVKFYRDNQLKTKQVKLGTRPAAFDDATTTTPDQSGGSNLLP